MLKIFFYLVIITTLCGCSLSFSKTEDYSHSKNIVSNIVSDDSDVYFNSCTLCPTEKITVNHFGRGSVIYNITGYELIKNLPSDDPKIQKSMLIVDIVLTNSSVELNDYTKATLANVFNITTYNAYSYKTANHESELAEISYEPVYFSLATSEPNTHSYFEYQLPQISDSISFSLGYELFPDEVKYLLEGKLYVSYAYEEKMILINPDQVSIK